MTVTLIKATCLELVKGRLFSTFLYLSYMANSTVTINLDTIMITTNRFFPAPTCNCIYFTKAANEIKNPIHKAAVYLQSLLNVYCMFGAERRKKCFLSHLLCTARRHCISSSSIYMYQYNNKLFHVPGHITVDQKVIMVFKFNSTTDPSLFTL